MVYARICIFLQITFLRKYFISGLDSEETNNFGLKTHSSVSDIFSDSCLSLAQLYFYSVEALVSRCRCKCLFIVPAIGFYSSQQYSFKRVLFSYRPIAFYTGFLHHTETTSSRLFFSSADHLCPLLYSSKGCQALFY